jgi:tRNA(adenine34) deaminase
MDENLYFMKEALKQAQKAYSLDETPVGAVVVYNGKIISRAYNKREMLQDPTAHAEIIALKKAASKIGSWRLLDCDIYVTLEPCAMCAGAIIHGRIRKVFIGAMDPKAGAAGSVVDLFNVDKFNHRVQVSSGIMENECSQILKKFFKSLREKKLVEKKLVGKKIDLD